MALETNFKWQLKSRVESRKATKAEKETHWREVCRLVTRREAGHCRVTGVRCDPHALGMLQRGEHHHIVYRSAGGGDTTDNCILVTKEIHDAIHAGKYRVEGNADDCLTVWRRDEDGGWVQIIRETPAGIERD